MHPFLTLKIGRLGLGLIMIGLSMLAGCGSNTSETALPPNANVRADGAIIMKGVPPVEKEPQPVLKAPAP